MWTMDGAVSVCSGSFIQYNENNAEFSLLVSLFCKTVFLTGTSLRCSRKNRILTIGFKTGSLNLSFVFSV